MTNQTSIDATRVAVAAEASAAVPAKAKTSKTQKPSTAVKPAAKKPSVKKAAAPKAAKVPAAKKAPVKTLAQPKAKAIAQPVIPVAIEKPVAPPKIKQKLVRDSFTMPRVEFDLIDALKERALGFKRPTKKSELLRAGLQALSAFSDAQLSQVLGALAPLKAGRPKNEG